MTAPCISGTAMSRLSNTAFSDLNCGRNRIRSNRCCSVSPADGGLASDILIIKLFCGNDASLRLARREQGIVVDGGWNVHDSIAGVVGDPSAGLRPRNAVAGDRYRIPYPMLAGSNHFGDTPAR